MRANLSDDDRFDKLPKWVKDRALGLESELRVQRLANRQLTKDYSDSVGDLVVLDPYGTKIPLGNTSVIRFYQDKATESWIDFHLERRKGHLGVSVASSDALSVMPRSANGANIENVSLFK